MSIGAPSSFKGKSTAFPAGIISTGRQAVEEAGTAISLAAGSARQGGRPYSEAGAHASALGIRISAWAAAEGGNEEDGRRSSRPPETGRAVSGCGAAFLGRCPLALPSSPSGRALDPPERGRPLGSRRLSRVGTHATHAALWRCRSMVAHARPALQRPRVSHRCLRNVRACFTTPGEGRKLFARGISLRGRV